MSDWHRCFDCQRELGGVLPEGATMTVTEGECPRCGRNRTLVPNDDYYWPKKGLVPVND